MPSSTTSIVSPLPPDPSTCGYCGPPGERSVAKTNHHAACLMPVRLTCETYQKMIDRGWRRSGEYCYKPDLKRACCTQYTIRLDALEFKPTKSQRKLINRFNRWVLYGDDHGDKKPNHKGKANDAFVLEEAIHQAERRVAYRKGDSDSDSRPEHSLEVTLEPASYTDEKFWLFQKYQKDIHKEQEKKPNSFRRFLVNTPLHGESIPYTSDDPIPEHLPRTYGSYHQLYKIDYKLVAMAVIDILPHCVSSVYFMYDSKWERFSLGKLSALREITLAKEMYEAGAVDMKWLYMGFYIHSCPKMRYKGEYSPSYLADPEDYSWHHLEECIPLLEKNRYACFTHPEHSIQGDYVGPPLSPTPSPSLLEKALYLNSISGNSRPTLAPVTTMPEYTISESARLTLNATIEALGEDILEDTWFYIMYEI